MLGLMSRAHEKAQAPEECQATATVGPDVCIAHLGARPPHASRSDSGGQQMLPQPPAWITRYLEFQSASYGQNTKILPGEATALAASSRAFTSAQSPVHLASLPGSTLPSHQAGVRADGRPLLARSKCSKLLLPQRLEQMRFKSGLDLQGAFYPDSHCRSPQGAGALSRLTDTHSDSEMTTACPGSSVSTTASLTLSKQPQSTARF